MGRVPVVAFASLVLLGTACTGSGRVPSGPGTQPVGQPGGMPMVVPARPAVAPTFRFEVGDEVGIDIWQEADLKSTQRILADGTISPPLLKTTKVVGLTIDEVQERLNVAYAEFLKFPKVAVRVESVYSDRVFVLGEVSEAEAVTLVGPMTALQAIAQAGGFEMEFANRKQVRVIRRGPTGQPVVLTVNADAVIAGQQLDVPLQRGDVVFVPTTGLANWSRSATQALSPIAGIVGIAGGVATVFLAADD